MPTPLLSWLKTQPWEYENRDCFPHEAPTQKSKIKTPLKKEESFAISKLQNLTFVNFENSFIYNNKVAREQKIQVPKLNLKKK